MSDVLLFSPLPLAQARTIAETAETLTRIGLTSRSMVPVPSTEDAGVSNKAKLIAHVRAVGRARRVGGTVLVLWPSLGWGELPLWLRSEALVFVHDPVPLVHQHGNGRVARLLGRLSARSGKNIVCHTREAALAASSEIGAPVDRVVLHPVLSNRVTVRNAVRTNTVLVAGQYKPVRDLDLLTALGPALVAAGFSPKIVGRGWPSLEGWEVLDGFVPEDVLDFELASAAAVLIPYRRYWQSGIAIRALETEVPVVGLHTEFLSSLVGEGFPGIVPQRGEIADWVQAVRNATSDAVDMDVIRQEYISAVDSSWKQLLRG